MQRKKLTVTIMALVLINIVLVIVLLFAAGSMGLFEGDEIDDNKALVTADDKQNNNENIIHDTKIEESKSENSQKELLLTEKIDSLYTYDDMEKDLRFLADNNKDKMKLSSIAETADGRCVYLAAVGKEGAYNQYIVNAGIHAREYITSKVVMLLLNDFLKEYSGEDMLIYFVPMVNPDGASVSQLGKDGINKSETLEKIKEIAANDGKSIDDREYLRNWKANANGVDLNRNFDAMWQDYKGSQKPSCELYKGESPGCESETAALIKLTKENPIKATISYHTMGEVVYWYFGQTGELLEKTKGFANEAATLTGYITDGNMDALDPAGYKDWAISKLSIPSITIEVGHGGNPVDESQTKDIYRQNKDILKVLTKY